MKKIKKNKIFIKIIGEIIKNLEWRYYLVKILQNYDYYNLKQNETYAVPFNLLRKCDNNSIKIIFDYNIKRGNQIIKRILK